MKTHVPHLSHPKYRPDIDGLRAVAVLSVVAFHAFPAWMKGGFIGVDVFFVISGFLISIILIENLDRGTFSFAEFYARRIKRIFPALLLVLVASYSLGWFALLADEYKQLGKHIAAGAGFISNYILWGESGYFDNSAETKPLLHLWSLGIEEQFYIVWPFVMWLAWKRNFNLLTLTILVAFISFSLNLKGIREDAVETFYSPQTRFWELLAGSILAWFALYKKNAFSNYKLKVDGWLAKLIYREAGEADGNTLSNFISFVGSLLLAFGFWRITEDVSFPGKWAVLPVLGAVLIILAGPNAWINRNILSNKIAVWFGLISFPLYLWHWPILSFARIVESEVPSRNIRVAAVLLSIVLAWLTYKLVERPLRFGQHSKVKVTALVVLMTIVGYVGYNTYNRDGLSFRFKFNVSMSEDQISAERAKYWAGNLDRKFNLLNKKAIVFGDSQGFDIYKSLLNIENLGIKIFQTSYECTSFNMAKNGTKDNAKKMCQSSFDRLINSEELKKATILIYSFYWSKEQEPQNSLTNYQAVVKRIKEINPSIHIYFFGPKPLLGTSWVSINTITKNHKSVFGMNEFLNRIKWIREEDTLYVNQLSKILGVNFIDVNEIFCSGDCQFYLDNKYAYFDQNHWTEFGGLLFYRNLINKHDFFKEEFD
ncbi:MAG: acyltransferase family protein [Pseudomonadota bacterium]